MKALCLRCLKFQGKYLGNFRNGVNLDKIDVCISILLILFLVIVCYCFVVIYFKFKSIDIEACWNHWNFLREWIALSIFKKCIAAFLFHFQTQYFKILRKPFGKKKTIVIKNLNFSEKLIKYIIIFFLLKNKNSNPPQKKFTTHTLVLLIQFSTQKFEFILNNINNWNIM